MCNKTKIFINRNSIENLNNILENEKVSNLLIFTGKNSFNNFKNIIEKQIKNYKTEYYNNFSPNPKKEDIQCAISKINDNFDLIIAIGGGSVIDFAKAFRFYKNSSVKLIAIPTTCGTGAEATQFAVIYENGKKLSLDDKSILPDYAVIDSQFVENNPKYLKACTSMDAYCQSIESYWAVNSTEESRKFAKEAIILCRDNIEEYVNSCDLEASSNMMTASYLSGCAINISRTTAPHALSYKMTTEYGIPHGHAAALTIAQTMEFNKNITNLDCNDFRGKNFVLERMNELYNILSIENPAMYFSNLFKKINLFCKQQNNMDLELLAKSVNIERLNNNPRKMDTDDIIKILSEIKVYS